MKTLSKVLSMLIVVVMCLSLFGASAYATGVPTVVGADPSANQTPTQGQTPSVPTVDLYNAGIEEPGAGDNVNDVIQYREETQKPVVGEPQDQTTSGTPVVDADKEANPDMQLRMSPNKVWKRGERGYDTLQDAINDTYNSSNVISLYDDVTTEATVAGGACAVNGQNLTINLDGKTITLNGYFEITGCTVTLNGGTIKNSGAIAQVNSNGTLVINSGKYNSASFTGAGKVVINGGTFGTDPRNLTNVTVNGTCTQNGSEFVVTAAAENVASITGKGSWATVKDAVANASNGDTIFINTNSRIDVPAKDLVIEKDIIFNVDDETVDFSGTKINNANVTINGYEAKGTITLTNSTLNLNTQKAGTIVANGKALSVNGGTVENVTLNGATLNMSSGTIGSLTTTGNDVLNVSGGNVNSFTRTGGSVNRAITGGTWKITGADNISHFKNCLADGRSWNANGDIYTVNGSGSTTNPGGSTTNPGQNGYALSTNAYTKGSNSSVYIVKGSNAPAVTSVWYSTSSTSLQQGVKLGSYNSGSYTYINNSSLDSMPVGTYYIFAAYNNDANASPAGTLTIYGRGTEIPSYGGSLQVGTRYENDWYQGEDPLQFYVNPFPGSGKDWTNMKVSIDNREVGNLDYYDYHNGYFYISTAKLESLGSGTHWLTVENIQTGEAGSCSFYVGATLKARDTNKHVTGSSKDLKFICSEPISRVWVGDKELDNYDSYDYYTLSRDGRTLTLTARFLNNRTAGNTYNLTVETVNGERVSTTFQILTTAQASSSPKTGDNSNLALWISALVMSGAAAAVIIPNVKRKEIEG